MISVLSVVVLMVAVGSVIQQSSTISGLFGWEDENKDKPALVNDFVTVRANDLAPIDIFRNDFAVTPQQQLGLKVNSHPTCGRLFIQGSVLQYLPEDRCRGKQTFVYSVPGVDSVATVTATVITDDDKNPQPQTPVATAPAETTAQQQVAAAPAEATEDQQIAAAAPAAEQSVAGTTKEPESAPVRGPTLSGGNSGTPKDIAAIQAYANKLRENARPQVVTAPEAPAAPEPSGAVQEELAAVVVAPSSSVSRADPPAAPQIVEPKPVETAATGSGELASIVSVAPGQPVLDGTDPGSDVSPGVQSDDRSPERLALAPAPALPAASEGQQILVAVVELREPSRIVPAAPEVPAINISGDFIPPATDDGLQIAALSPFDADIGALSLGVPLSADPVDLSQGPYVPEPAPAPEVEDKATGAAEIANPTPPRARPTIAQDAEEQEQLAALRPQSEACQTPPSLSIDLRRAAQTIVGISSRCHADSIAQLSYSGLSFAIPLDGRGNGSLTAPGLESNAPAVVSFVDGEETQFDLPFKGMNRVVRIAVIWDEPIALELNALEFGAPVGSARHIGPTNRRSFNEVRRDGGGFLTSYRGVGGIGRNVDVYSLWLRGNRESGVVDMRLDYASRNRDRLPEACGNGRYASPEYIVLRSLGGRLERPVTRRLAAVSCSKVADETGENRLISGAIADLIVR